MDWSIWLAKLTKVLTYTGHGHYNGAAASNKDFYDNLSSKDKKLVDAAGAYAHAKILKEAQNLDAIGLGKIVRKIPNYKIVTLTEAERVPFIKAAQGVQDKFASKNPSSKELLMQMRNDVKNAVEIASKNTKK